MPLNTKKPVGNGVNAPVYFDGVANIISTTSASVNQGTNINETASTENLSAKFKNPNVSQDVPSEGQGQYM